MPDASPAAASTMARPKLYDPAVVRLAAGKLAEECVAWDRGGRGVDWVSALVKEARDWDDGYKLARALESYHYVSPDSELVEILGGAFIHLNDAHEIAVRQWVKFVGFAPQFDVGDRVTWQRPNWSGEGEIVEISHETAEYVVSDGDPKFARGGGYVLNAEDLCKAEGQPLSALTAI